MLGRTYKFINKDLEHISSIPKLSSILAERRSLLFDNEKSRGTLKDLDLAIERIKTAKANNEKVKVIGDYDVDGEVSTYILTKGLRDYGLDVDYRIPERLTEGYGVSVTMLREEFRKGVNLCITCDNGIASNAFETVELLDMDFIITDHHKTVKDSEGNDVLPKGVVAIVNPKRQDCTYGSKDICGAVVALELIEKLMGREYIEDFDFIELACLATICDVVPMRGYSREIVARGLKKMSNTKNLGLSALIKNKVKEGDKITTYTCGFLLGPCLNASGRLETANLSVELLFSKTKEAAELYANKLTGLNKDRQLLTEQGLEEALEKYEPDRQIQFIVIPMKYEPVCGIIAGNIKEKFNKPTLVCSYNEQKKMYKGSGRSTEYYNMFDEIGKSKMYLETFGGHEMAIGFGVSEQEVDIFKFHIEHIQKDVHFDTRKKVNIEAVLDTSLLVESTVLKINELEPFGSGNEKPLFMSICNLYKFKRVGSTNNVLQLTFRSKGKYFNGVAFKNADEFDKYIMMKSGSDILQSLYDKGVDVPIKVVYSLDLNNYNNRNYVKLRVESII